MRIELGVEPVERRAIGADIFRVVAHVAEYVRVVERGQGADAHEFLGADLDCRNPKIVMEMRNYIVCHALSLLAVNEHTITARNRDFHRRVVKTAAN